jgi:hypothetical protein
MDASKPHMQQSASESEQSPWMLGSARKIGKLVSTALVAAVTFVTESSPHTQTLPATQTIAEMNRRRMALFDENTRIFGPYLASIHRILISVMNNGRLQ